MRVESPSRSDIKPDTRQAPLPIAAQIPDRAVRRQPHGRVRRCSASAAEAAEQLRVGAL